MKRFDCLKYLSEGITEELVVVGLTGVNWEWGHLSDRAGNMMAGSMGNATAVGLGMALALPHRKVVVLDSDGSVLLDLATLTTIGTYQPENLSVFVFDNELYGGSRIRQPSATAFRSSIEHIAQGAGIANATTVRTLDAFEAAAGRSLVQLGGPHYIVAKVEEDLGALALPKTTRDFLENKYHFVRHIEEIEGVEILEKVL